MLRDALDRLIRSLQWSRIPKDAEGSLTPTRTTRDSPLQWSRIPKDAEGAASGSPSDTTRKLQWSRIPKDAEGGAAQQRSVRRGRASMEPHPEGRGRSAASSRPSRRSAASFNGAASRRTRKVDHADRAARRHVDASMEPHPEGRGRGSSDAWPALDPEASMEPHPEGRGRGSSDAWPALDPEASMEPDPEGRGRLWWSPRGPIALRLLQWSRIPKDAEGRTRFRREAFRERSFNGAASRRTRKALAPRRHRARDGASMEPHPEGRGRTRRRMPGRLRLRSGLQWSRIPKDAEGRCSPSGSRSRSSRFNGAASRRTRKAVVQPLVVGDAGRASMEPHPEGRGRAVPSSPA